MILKNTLGKCIVMFLATIITFFIHFFINNQLEQQIAVGQLIYSYAVNFIMACVVVATIMLLKKKLRDQLGFVFMGTSMLKFVFFFLLFYPGYNADGDLSRLEFFTFFVPYLVCLITESIILSKFFNGLDDQKTVI